MSNILDKEPHNTALPIDWGCRTLGEIAEITMGNSPPGESYNEDGNGVPLVNGPVEFSEGAFGYTKKIKFTTAPTKMCKSGDFLICVRGSTTGRTNIAAFDACIGRGVASIRTNLSQPYVNHFVRTLEKRIHASGKGSTFPSISQQQLADLQVPLPRPDNPKRSTEEQNRIADILDKADSIRRKRQDGIFSYDLLSDSLFHQLSRDCHVQPRTVAELIDSNVLLVHKDGNFGGSYPRKHEFGTEGIPFLSAKHVKTDGTLSTEDVPRLNEEKARTLPFGWIERGDVLLAHNATVGPVALYDGNYEEALIGTSLTCYRPNSSLLNAEFLFAALRGSHFQQQLTKQMSQTTRNQVPITAQRKLTLHIPSLEQQQSFANQLSAIRTLRKKHATASVEANTLFNSLVQRAFKGEL